MHYSFIQPILVSFAKCFQNSWMDNSSLHTSFQKLLKMCWVSHKLVFTKNQDCLLFSFGNRVLQRWMRGSNWGVAGGGPWNSWILKSWKWEVLRRRKVLRIPTEGKEALLWATGKRTHRAQQLTRKSSCAPLSARMKNFRNAEDSGFLTLRPRTWASPPFVWSNRETSVVSQLLRKQSRWRRDAARACSVGRCFMSLSAWMDDLYRDCSVV